jgi:carboxyl-terminal processing protease
VHARSPAAVHTVKITRAVVSEPVVESITRTVHGVKLGVVALASFSDGSHVEVREAVEHELHAGARGLVFDLRGNGGGLVAEAQLIASIFIPKGVIVTTRGRNVPTQVLDATGGAISSSIPMVVLVDSNTASSSEIVTAALQDHHRATVVGTHTFGKGVFQEEQGLANGGALDITVGEFFTPDGRNLGGGGVKQGAGVIPEVLVPSDDVDSNRGLQVALSTLAAKVK